MHIFNVMFLNGEIIKSESSHRVSISPVCFDGSCIKFTSVYKIESVVCRGSFSSPP
jgi:hypothetical protein